MIHRLLALGALLSLPALPVRADPCGMVPPIYTGQGAPIERVGPQKTYVLFKDGVQTMALRPGFSGRVDQFGMLIPFPSVPELRKVDDNLFPHLGAAVDPPEVVLDLTPIPKPMPRRSTPRSVPSAAPSEPALAYDEVRVVRQEAVGMYQIAVLEAGSAAALQRWMDENGFRYPEGMDAAVNDYVAARWVFVAVKTRVGSKPASDPKPGMRAVDPSLPPGASFDGHVQAMGFRFRVDQPVVPMRLSAFNEGRPHNVVYALTETPVRIVGIDETFVRRQVPGRKIRRNVTGPLPVRLVGGKPTDISEAMVAAVRTRRDPAPHNLHARVVLAADLAAIRRGELSLSFEEREKALLNIGESLNLRDHMDALHQEAVDAERKKVTARALRDLDGLTFTVIDGLFDKGFLAEANLRFAQFRMPAHRNAAEHYDARMMRPGGARSGIVLTGPLRARTKKARFFRVY